MSTYFTRFDVDFVPDGERCAAWHYMPVDALAREPVPVALNWTSRLGLP